MREDYSADVWRIGDSKPVSIFGPEKRKTAHVALSADGAQMATTDGFDLKLWGADQNTPITTFVTDGHSIIETLVMSRDGTLILTLGETARLWRAGEKQPVLSFATPENDTLARAAFSSDGRMVALYFEYGGVQVWRIDELNEVDAFSDRNKAGARVSAIAFSSDGRTITVGREDGSVSSHALNPFLFLPADQQVSQACALLKQIGLSDFTGAERSRFFILRNAPANPCGEKH